MISKYLYAWLLVYALVAFGCSKSSNEIAAIRQYPIRDLQGIITQTGIEFDPQASSDGNGSLHITTTDSVTVRLFETGDIDVEDARLVYRAKLKTRDLTGKAYLEMWCHFQGQVEFFSRGLHNPLSGTNDWSSAETFFMLQKGENPDNVRLNLVISGAGEAWIDDIMLEKAPLK